jgi:hypothetical protein
VLVGSILAASVMLASSGVSAQSPSIPGRNTVEGQVTKVDAQRGWIDVKTSEGSMKLHFPPPALDGVKKGDSVTVELGLTSQGPAAKK